jgi:bloom syndrome protein
MLDDLVAERRRSDEPVPDPNHENVVLISSDDDEDAGFLQPSSGSAPSPNVRSRFFSGDDSAITQFMEQSE